MTASASSPLAFVKKHLRAASSVSSPAGLTAQPQDVESLQSKHPWLDALRRNPTLEKMTRLALILQRTIQIEIDSGRQTLDGMMSTRKSQREPVYTNVGMILLKNTIRSHVDALIIAISKANNTSTLNASRESYYKQCATCQTRCKPDGSPYDQDVALKEKYGRYYVKAIEKVENEALNSIHNLFRIHWTLPLIDDTQPNSTAALLKNPTEMTEQIFEMIVRNLFLEFDRVLDSDPQYESKFKGVVDPLAREALLREIVSNFTDHTLIKSLHRKPSTRRTLDLESTFATHFIKNVFEIRIQSLNRQREQIQKDLAAAAAKQKPDETEILALETEENLTMRTLESYHRFEDLIRLFSALENANTLACEIFLSLCQMQSKAADPPQKKKDEFTKQLSSSTSGPTSAPPASKDKVPPQLVDTYVQMGSAPLGTLISEPQLTVSLIPPKKEVKEKIVLVFERLEIKEDEKLAALQKKVTEYRHLCEKISDLIKNISSVLFPGQQAASPRPVSRTPRQSQEVGYKVRLDFVERAFRTQAHVLQSLFPDDTMTPR